MVGSVSPASKEWPEMCENPRLSRLEYAPHRVWVHVTTEGTIEPRGESDLLDSPWDETDSYWCHGCDTELDGPQAAIDHVQGAA